MLVDDIRKMEVASGQHGVLFVLEALGTVSIDVFDCLRVAIGEVVRRNADDGVSFGVEFC